MGCNFLKTHKICIISLLTFWLPGSLWPLKKVYIYVCKGLCGTTNNTKALFHCIRPSSVEHEGHVSWGWLDGDHVFAWEDELGTQLMGKGQDRALSIYFLPGPRKISDTWEALGKNNLICMYVCMYIYVCVCVCVYIYIYIYIYICFPSFGIFFPFRLPQSTE